MANKYRTELEIVLDKPRVLKITNNAVMSFESETGHSILHLDIDNMSHTKFMQLGRVALLHDFPDITIEEACDLFDYANRHYVINKLMELWTIIYEADEEEKKVAEEAKKKKTK
jgi:hypothetical protein